ncbi:MAG: hypothetical protein LAT81_14460 [Oceanicaulis sp.]|nr:hypothetical protein [Oceanicaulis sp.]
MKLIQDNPYRIAGILANASAREVIRQKGRITRSAGIGRHIESEFDFSFLNAVDRTDQNEVSKAFAGIEQNQDKVSHSLFWFLKTNTFDETAINYLINGDREKAVEIWEKVTYAKEITSRNFSCFNNIGTLKLLGESKQELQEGIEAKIKLIESPTFENFGQTVADQTYTIDNQKQTEKFVDDILKQFKGKYSSADTLKLFSNCSGTIQKYLLQKFTGEPLHKIENQIESTKNIRKSKKSGAYELGLKLFMNCKNDLECLKSLLGTRDLKYKMIADNLAKEVMQCGIDYFQELKESKNPSEEGLKLLKYAQSIALGTQTRDRIKENINGIEEFAKIAPVKIELDFVTQKLARFQNISDTVSNAKELVMSCKPKLLSIKKSLGADNELYLNISSAVVGNAQGMLVTAVNEAQENIGGDMFQRLLGISSFKNIVEEALEVSFMFRKFDLNYDLKNHCNQNLKALKGLAEQLDIATLSPEEKIETQIRKLQNELSRTRNRIFFENELKSANQKMEEIKQWQLFRSQETRIKQIADQTKVIDSVKQKAETNKQSKIRELEAQISTQKQELKKLK